MKIETQKLKELSYKETRRFVERFKDYPEKKRVRALELYVAMHKPKRQVIISF